jgi:hypothetical protein
MSNRVLPGVAERDHVEVGDTCPVCLDPFHGGFRISQGVDGLYRVACADEHACLDAYVRNDLSATVRDLRRRAPRRLS